MRALAVTAVLLYHASVGWMPGGFLGVDVFFTLSGYLITSLLLAEIRETSRLNLPSFWLRRAKRLLPALFVVIAVELVVAAFLARAEGDSVRGDALSGIFYINNWHQIFGNHSYFAEAGRPSGLRHLWSLSVEEQFYLLWPLLLAAGLALLGRARMLRAMGVAAVASAILMAVLYRSGHDPSRVYYGTDTRATQLLLGAMLAFVWPLREVRTALAPPAVAALDAAAALGLAVLVAMFLTVDDFDSWVYRGGLVVVAIASALLIAAVVHPACRVRRVLALPPVRWVGERSYGIYLWHWPIMVLTRPELDVTWSPWVRVPLQVALSVGLAAASYRWIEVPIRRGDAIGRLRERVLALEPARRFGTLGAAALVVVIAFVWMLRPAAPQPHRATATRAASAKPVAPATTTPTATRAPLAVGASVMLGAQDALRAALGPDTIVDAAVGRWPRDIAGRLEAYRQAGTLPDTVIVQIGENGPIEQSDLDRIRKALEGVRRVVLVTVHIPRSWQDEVNANLTIVSHEWKNVEIADWNKIARPDLLYADGIHLNAQGQQAYARLIARAVQR